MGAKRQVSSCRGILVTNIINLPISEKTLTSAFKRPIRVSTIYLGYLTNQPLCGPEGGGGRGVGWASGVLSVEHSRDLHGGRQGLMGEAHFSAR